MILVTIFLGLVALSLFLWWHIIDRYLYFHRRKIPFLTPTFPGGNFNGVIRNVHLATWVRNHYLQYRGRDKILGYYFGTAPSIMITDMDTAYDILVRDFKTFPSAHSKWNDPLAANLMTMEGEQWRTIRTKLSPVFSAMSTRSVLASMQTVGEDLVSHVDQFVNSENPLNVRDLFMRYMSDAISASMLGMDTAALREENHPLMDISELMFKARSRGEMLAFFFIVSYSRFMRLLPIRIFPAAISDYFIGIMDEAMRTRVANAGAGNDAARNDLLDLLVRIEAAGCLTDDETGEVLDKITHNQLLGHAFMTFLLGFITSRVALNFGLYELAKNAEIQKRLREEIFTAIPEGQEITYDSLESMIYLQQVVDGEKVCFI